MIILLLENEVYLYKILAVPAVERIVYSTCSVSQIENEDVVNSVLPSASTHGFQLATTFPQWPRRGLPTFDGCKFAKLKYN